MDTKLNLNADEGSLGNRELVTPVSVEQRTAGARPMRVKASSDSLRRVRIAVGEYARTSGMYDPVDVVVFTKMCIHEARARVPSAGLESSDALLKEALKVAAASCGVCHRQLVDTTGTNATELAAEPKLSASASFAARITHRAPVVPLPESYSRSMPAQSLGELPDMRPATMLNSLMQIMWRPVNMLITAMFVRSE